MNLLQALAYFVREASIGLVRSWRVSLLAIVTIGVSLFLAGGFLLTSRNLARAIHEWKLEARFVVYLAEASTPDQRREAVEALRSAPWSEGVEEISPETGAERFRAAFPSLTELVDGSRYGRLPTSLEARLRTVPAEERSAYETWVDELRALPAVEMVDDDREWIADVETILAFTRAVGSLLTAMLLGAAVFTIAAVVRLTSFLYRDEIAIMRLVGATEFFIRGPFYVEGILQGLLGAVLAWAALHGVHLGLEPRIAQSSVLSIVLREFLTAREAIGLAMVGGLAGFGGALVSLGRERPASLRND